MCWCKYLKISINWILVYYYNTALQLILLTNNKKFNKVYNIIVN